MSQFPASDSGVLIQTTLKEQLIAVRLSVLKSVKYLLKLTLYC